MSERHNFDGVRSILTNELFNLLTKGGHQKLLVATEEVKTCVLC